MSISLTAPLSCERSPAVAKAPHYSLVRGFRFSAANANGRQVYGLRSFPEISAIFSIFSPTERYKLRRCAA
jgi:hypothetical protein